MATSKVSIRVAWPVSSSATNQRVLPWKALSASSEAVATRNPPSAGDVFERGELGGDPFASLGLEGEERLEVEGRVGRGVAGDVGGERPDLVARLPEADDQLAADAVGRPGLPDRQPFDLPFGDPGVIERLGPEGRFERPGDLPADDRGVVDGDLRRRP